VRRRGVRVRRDHGALEEGRDVMWPGENSPNLRGASVLVFPGARVPVAGLGRGRLKRFA